MKNKFKFDTLVLASGNQKKLVELQACLKPLGIEVKPQSEFGVTDADETGLTFVENAILKARHAAQATGLPALADDSGLEVDALQGAPGIYSARYAQLTDEGSGDAANNEKLLRALQGTEHRCARFQCVLALMVHGDDPTPLICQGAWEGTILAELTGSGGFGYDPLFYLAEHDKTAAQLAPEVKNQVSHRGQAMAKLLAHLSNA